MKCDPLIFHMKILVIQRPRRMTGDDPHVKNIVKSIVPTASMTSLLRLNLSIWQQLWFVSICLCVACVQI